MKPEIHLCPDCNDAWVEHEKAKPKPPILRYRIVLFTADNLRFEVGYVHNDGKGPLLLQHRRAMKGPAFGERVYELQHVVETSPIEADAEYFEVLK